MKNNEYEVLIGRLVRVTWQRKSMMGELLKLERHYGRIIRIDTNRTTPFLIEFVQDNGLILREYFNAYDIEVIR